MAKTIKILILVCFCAFATFNAGAQEMQISFGLDANMGVYTVNNTVFKSDGIFASYFTEETENAFFSPGLNFTLRTFSDTESKISSGLIFKQRLLVMTHANTEGYLNGYYVNEDLGIKDLFMLVSDTGLGIASRINLSKKINFISDVGFNITFFEYSDYGNKESLSYYGAGIFADLAFQFDITKKVYLELGLFTAMSMFSSQEGETWALGSRVKYEDTGRNDLVMASIYLNIGWRIDFKKEKNPDPAPLN